MGQDTSKDSRKYAKHAGQCNVRYAKLIKQTGKLGTGDKVHHQGMAEARHAAGDTGETPKGETTQRGKERRRGTHQGTREGGEDTTPPLLAPDRGWLETLGVWS